MNSGWKLSICLVAWNLVLGTYCFADDAKTEKVTKGEISVYQKTTGIVESATLTPLKTDTKVWKTLVIESIVPEGTAVKKGDLVLSFETAKYQKAVADATLAFQSAQLDLQDAELALEQFEKTFEMDLEQAKRAFEQAKEDYEYYLKVEIPQRTKMQEYRLKSSEWSLENELEEYNQLKKMYEEDELTEESELIVLKRAKRSVDATRMFLEQAKQSYERSTKVLNPRADQMKKEAFAKVEIGHRKQLVDLRAKLERAKIAVEKAKLAFDKQKKDYQNLKNDEKKLNLHAPADGIVYYGKCTRGKWTSGSGTPNRVLKKDKPVTAGQVVVTIVDPAALQVRVAVNEALLGKLKPGSKGTAIANSNASSKAGVSISQLSRIPVSEGSFNCIATVDSEGKLGWMPGMTCKVVFNTYRSEDALLISKTSVFSDDEGLSHYVYLKKGEETEKVSVSVGESSGSKIEITDGLSEGDEVLKKKP